MKTMPFRTCVFAILLAGLSAPAVSTQAIPNVIGGAGFINPAGMRFEDFASQPAAWKANADLKATWENWHDESIRDRSIEVLKLAMPAIVFGVAVDQITVYRRQGRPEKFHAIFRPKKNLSFEKLNAILRRNLATWADSGSGDVFVCGAARIEMRQSENEESLIVTFSPKTS